uniref:BTB domain-containing protein n=1 Tax=Panagrellus redivivus TaxID=6233 RepID=A0A7E4VE30_PANRE
MSSPQDSSLLIHLGNMCTDDSYSDVVFHIGDVQLPAHRIILSHRSSVFSALFLKEKYESQKQLITMTETTVNAFKPFLKFIYTGVIDFTGLQTEIVFGILRLASTHQIKHLVELTVDHLKSVCDADNVCDILNEAAKLEQEYLRDHCLTHMKSKSYDNITFESFKKLSTTAITHVLKDAASVVPGSSLFHAFVKWLKANPTESIHYVQLLKCINLTAMEIEEMVDTIPPSTHIDANDLLKIVFEQSKTVNFPTDNVLTPRYEVQVVTGGNSTFFTIPKEGSTLKHVIDNTSENIMIDLKRTFMLNYFEMELAQGNWSYWIEISVDNNTWTCIIDYSDYKCRSVQRLFFEERPVRYIRIRGTATGDETFEILRLEAYHLTQPLKVNPETGIVIPTSNVALEEKNAVVIQGENWNGGMLNGSAELGWTCHKIGEDPIIVQLPQPYLLDSMNLKLGGCSYSYDIDISIDKINWTRVFGEEKVNGLRHAEFDKQPVVFIKLTNTYGTNLFNTFYCLTLECPAITM